MATILAASCGGGSEDIEGQRVTGGGNDSFESGGSTEHEVVTFATFGGMRLGVPAGIETYTEDDYIEIREPSGAGKVVIARVSMTPGGQPIHDVDGLLDVIGLVEGATASQVEGKLSIFGHDLQLYEIRTEDPTDGIVLFAARPAGLGGNTFWAPLPNSDLYLATVPGGVMAVGVVGADLGSFDLLTSMLDDVLTTVSLTTPDEKIADFQFSKPFDVLGEFDPITSREGVEGSPPALVQAFAPVQAGRYDLVNLSVPVSVELSNAGIKPNQPGFIVVSQDGSSGPGDHDIYFHQGVNAVSAVGLGLAYDGPPTPLADLEQFLENPPSTLEVSNVEVVEIDGRSATRFDLRVSAEASCQQGNRCAYTMTTADLGVGRDIKPGIANRFWWFENVEDAPLVISASAPEASSAWLDGVPTDIVESLLFN